MYSVSRHSKYLRVKRGGGGGGKKTGCTLFLYLSDLFHSFLQDCTFVRLDIEVVNVIEVGENELSELFDVFVLLLTIALLIAPLGTKKEKNTGLSVDIMKNDRNVYLDVYHSNQIKGEKKGLAKVFQKEDGSVPDFRERKKKSYLGPKSSDEQSLRFRDSALAGSDGISPTPLIIKAYQRLKHRSMF